MASSKRKSVKKEKKPGRDLGKELKELVTGTPATYSENKEPKTAEKEQMREPQYEFIEEKARPSGNRSARKK
jgi:hypothetical protein